MPRFWLIGITIFVVLTIIVAKLTLKQNRAQAGEKVWKIWNGRATYWQLLCLTTFGITTGFMFLLHWAGVPVF